MRTLQVSGGDVVASAVRGDGNAHHGAQHVGGVLSGVKGVGLRSAVACRPVEIVEGVLRREKKTRVKECRVRLTSEKECQVD